MTFPSFAEEFAGAFKTTLCLNVHFFSLRTEILMEIYLKFLLVFFVVAGSEHSFLLSYLGQTMTEQCARKTAICHRKCSKYSELVDLLIKFT